MTAKAGETLTSKTLNAAKWTYLSTVLSAFLQIAVTAALARLLAPDAFGLVAMSALVLRFGQYFAQMGVGQSIIQRQQLNREHVAAGFWASVVIGLIFTLAAWMLAPLAARIFEAPELSPVLRVMGLSFVVLGTSTTAFALLRREMRFKVIAVTEILAYSVGYGGAVVLAFAGFGVWALVFAGLGQSIVASISYNLLVRPSMQIITRREPYGDLLRFGTAVSFVSFLEFLNSNLDTMVVGRLAGPTSLGYYSRALSLTGLPMQYISTSFSRVLLPSFSRIQKETERTGRAYLVLITVFAGLGLPIALGMSGAAREIVNVVLGPQWQASIPVMRIIALASAAAMLSHFGGILMEATARLREKMVLRLGQLAAFIVLIAVLGRYGLAGYAWAFAVSEVSHLAAQSVLLARITSIRLRDIVDAYIPGFFGGTAALVTLYAESRVGAAAGMSSVILLLIQITSGCLILLVTALFVRGGQLYHLLRERLIPGASPFTARILRLADGILELRGAWQGARS